MCASIIACNLAIGSGRPATASGVAILGACSRSGHVADAQVGEIPGFARQPPPTGVAEMSASGHRLHLGGDGVVWCNDCLPPPPGWHIWDAVWWSPHVADTPVGEIRGYAQRQPPTGVGNYLAFGHHLPTAEWQRWHPKPGAAYLPDLQKVPCSGRGRARGYILSEAGYFTTTDCVLTPVLTM